MSEKVNYCTQEKMLPRLAKKVRYYYIRNFIELLCPKA